MFRTTSDLRCPVSSSSCSYLLNGQIVRMTLSFSLHFPMGYKYDLKPWICKEMLMSSFRCTVCWELYRDIHGMIAMVWGATRTSAPHIAKMDAISDLATFRTPTPPSVLLLKVLHLSEILSQFLIPNKVFQRRKCSLLHQSALTPGPCQTIHQSLMAPYFHYLTPLIRKACSLYSFSLSHFLSLFLLFSLPQGHLSPWNRNFPCDLLCLQFRVCGKNS